MSLKYFFSFFVREKEQDIQDIKKGEQLFSSHKKTHIVLVIVNDTNKLLTEQKKNFVG